MGRQCWSTHSFCDWTEDHTGAKAPALRDPIGVHGVFVNGVQVFAGKDYARLDKGPGQVLDRFLPTRANPMASAAQ